jgi:hypothetical protein
VSSISVYLASLRGKTKPPERGPWRCKKYRMFVASKPCVICGQKTQAAHTKNGGMRLKGPDWTCVPLCPMHHSQRDGRIPMPGKISHRLFEVFYRVDLSAVAERIYQEWEETRR